MRATTMMMAAALLVTTSSAVWAAPAERLAHDTTVQLEDRCCGYRGHGEGRGWHGEDRGFCAPQERGYCYDGGAENR